MKRFLLLIILICLASSRVYATGNEKEVLNRFLHSQNLSERQKAFTKIVANGNAYKDVVLDELLKYSKVPDKIPDALIYLAAFIKDKRYIAPLARIIEDADYSECHCIYSCPIVFSLAIFGSFTNYPLPKLNEGLVAVSDLRSEIEMARGVSTKPEKASKHMGGPGVDQLLIQTEKLPLNKVIKLAGPVSKDWNQRLVAAVVLQYNITDDKYLKELYWLAITDMNDASAEYRTAIYGAIYRAEKARRMRNT